MFQKIKTALMRLRAYFPSTLPRSVEEFDNFTSSIFSLYSLPDLPSYRHAVASMIMHLGPTTASASKRYFALSIQKAMSNQIAYTKIQEIKDAEKSASEVTEPSTEVTHPSTEESHVGQENGTLSRPEPLATTKTLVSKA